MIMYDASAKNKTQKKIRNEPIENIMFNDSDPPFSNNIDKIFQEL